MSRVPSLSSPFLIGFDQIERALDRVAKAADGYPPYNIERLAADEKNPERLRITLAVAGFTLEQLEVTVERKSSSSGDANRMTKAGSSCIAASPRASFNALSCWRTECRCRRPT